MRSRSNNACSSRQFALRSIATATTLVVAGCAVGPDYHPPRGTLEPSFVNAGSTSSNPQVPGSDISRFWEAFGDPALSDLVGRALVANGDVRIARARLQEERATLGGVRAEYFPEIDASANASRSLSPSYLYPGTTRGQRTSNVLDTGFIANWELDFFGKTRRASEGAAALVEASQAGVHAAQTIVAAEVARNYLELRGLQQRHEVAARSLANLQETLQLTTVRQSAGRGTRLDVVRAQSLVDSTKASLPSLQAGIERAAFRLATLTAQAPRTVLVDLSVPTPLPSLPVTDLSALPIGTPQQLLQRRPDLVVSERQLAAATAEIGVATADLFPRISLTGLIGFAGNGIDNFGSRNNERFTLGAGLSWPLLDFGRVRSRIGASQARAAQALASYEQTVATALEETEDSLSQFTRTAEQVASLSSAASNAEEATRLSKVRFEAGSVDLLIVLDAERQALSSRDELVRAQVAQAEALVSVYRSLGGGWIVDVQAAQQRVSAERADLGRSH